MTYEVQYVKLSVSNELDKVVILLQYKIKEFREKKNMSQEELSRKANVSRATISALESGTARVTTTETLSRIANALDKKVSDIFF